jgi:hypothetical protein
MVEPLASLAPQPVLGWPPPGGTPVRAPVTIAGVSQRGTVLDMGAPSGAAAAPLLFQLPAGAGNDFLTLQLITMSGLGHGPLSGGDSGANASNGTLAHPGSGGTAHYYSWQALSETADAGGPHRGGGNDGGGAGGGGGVGVGGGGAAAAAAAAAGSYPEAGCWALLLWGVARNLSAPANSSGALTVRNARLLVPAQELQALAHRARQGGPTFQVWPAGA